MDPFERHDRTAHHRGELEDCNAKEETEETYDFPLGQGYTILFNGVQKTYQAEQTDVAEHESKRKLLGQCPR